MYINKLEWDDYRIKHIASHGIEPFEVWEVCEDPRHLAHREGYNRYRLYGRTGDGRYLFIVLEQTEKRVFKPVTARDMTDNEKKNYRRLIK